MSDFFERVCGSVILRCDVTLGTAELIASETGEVIAVYGTLPEIHDGRAWWKSRNDDMAAALGIAITALED